MMSQDFAGLCSWFRKNCCITYITPPYHPQSNEIAEWMVQAMKIMIEGISPYWDNINSFLLRLLLNHWTMPYAVRLQSPSTLMGRLIKALLTMPYSMNEKIWCRKNSDSAYDVFILVETASDTLSTYDLAILNIHLILEMVKFWFHYYYLFIFFYCHNSPGL